MNWIRNVSLPVHPGFAYRDPHYTPRGGEPALEIWCAWQEWLKDKTVDAPVATEWYTVEELVARGMVGIYVQEGQEA